MIEAGGLPNSPEPARASRSQSRSNDSPNAGQWSKSRGSAHLLGPRGPRSRPMRRARPPRPNARRGGARRQDQRVRGADQQVVEVAFEVCLEPFPFRVVEHGAPLLVEHPADARVEHDQPGRAEVAAVAPAGPIALPRSLAANRRSTSQPSSASRTRCEQLALAQQLRREVADVLIEPIGGDARRLALGPPVELAHILDPGLRDVPVVVDVVVVDHHRDRDRRQQPADVRVLPRLAIKARVLLEVGDLLARRLADVAPLADEGERLGRDLVGVHLVAEQQQRERPAAPGRRAASPSSSE